VGRIAALYRHPVKSMGAQPLTGATIDRYGITGDRRFALRRRGDEGGFPWLTAGKLPALVGYRVESCDEHGAPASLRSPSGEIVACEADAISDHFRRAHGVEVELMHLRQGIFDCAGVSILTLQTLASLEAMCGMQLDVRRFRPNVVVDTGAEGVLYPENEWVGWSLAFGDPSTGARVSVTELDERCAMINIDPDDGHITPQILKAVVKQRDNFTGVYTTPTRPGECAVGEVVYAREE
jgi:uncharacterized protein YcbX